MTGARSFASESGRAHVIVLTVLALLAALLGFAGVAQGSSPEPKNPDRADANAAGAVAYSSSGDLMAVGAADGRIFVYRTSNGNRIRTLRGHAGAAVTALAFRAGTDTLASASLDSTIRIWKQAKNRGVRVLSGHEQPALSLAWSPDGKQLISGGEDSRALLWNVRDERVTDVFGPNQDFVTAVAFSPNGRRIAAATRDTRIRLWNPSSGAAKGTLRGHAKSVSSLSFAPNGRSLASGSADGTVKLWSVKKRLEQRSLDSHDGRVTSVAFNTQGTLASGGADGTVRLWNRNTGALQQTVRTGSAAVADVTFSPDGKQVLEGATDGVVSSYAVSSGERTAATVLPGPKAAGGSEAADGDSAPTALADEDASGSVSAAALDTGPGGPILLVTSASADPYSSYYAEILRAEGLNEFTTIDVSALTSTTLSSYDVILLAARQLTTAQADTVSTWVNSGGNLIAMRPDARLAGLLGLTANGTPLSEGYLRVDTSSAPGNGIVGETMQFHGAADRYTLNGARAVATLYTNATTATTNPAVSLRDVGTQGGQAAAFSYDLARSIALTRQGNPAWDGDERDGLTPIRSDDLYYGNASGDPRADWVDLNKVAIPQADEQQRLLVNLVLEMNKDRKPLPRFWYLPSGHKAAVVMTGDDHGSGGTGPRFDSFIDASPAGCVVADWECIRGTSYIFRDTPLSNAQAVAYQQQGFEVGLHVNTNCSDYTATSLNNDYSDQLDDWAAKYTGVAAPKSSRTHCIAWSDWTSQANVELSKGIRFDTNYYYWPPGWVQDRPGFFTGSGMPMRFTDPTGAMIDVYQSATQLTDESGQSYPDTINTLLDRANGPEGYYGAFTINAHTDVADIIESSSVVASAKAHGVPVVSAKQMLDWVDGRNASALQNVSWSGGQLSFTVAAAAQARNLQTLVPVKSTSGTLMSVTRNGVAVNYQTRAIKGSTYAFVPSTSGAYVALYANDTTAPTTTGIAPQDGATGVGLSATATVTFNEDVDPATVSANTFELRAPNNSLVPATVSYDAATRTARLTPTGSLNAQTSYTATIKGGTPDPVVRDLAGNALAASRTWSFTTAAGPSCPCSVWPNSAQPGTTSVSDPNAVELGMRFRSDVSGFITGVRFWKGAANNGTHTGNLWSNTGDRLATAVFTGESNSGWQTVTFSSPVPVTANTTYIASYHTTSGNYAADNGGFATAGVDNAPLHALRDGQDGDTGVYAYGANSQFPSQSWQSSNYWVDVVFATSTIDTTAPTVTATSPVDGATGVGRNTPVSATFNEALDPATVSDTTVTLTGPGATAVQGTVSYNAATRTATLQPTAQLAPSTAYTATFKGGAGAAIKDTAGIALATNATVAFTTEAVDTTAPNVTSTSPVNGATGVGRNTAVSATFNEALAPASVSATTVTLTGPGGAAVPGTVSYNVATRTATLQPSAQLAQSTAYTATFKGGAGAAITDTSGNALATNVTVAFTTGGTTTTTSSIWPSSAAPVNQAENDPNAVELGVRFRADVDGFITGVKFWKGAANNGTHTGNLWTNGGQRLATAVFSGESASGWQTVTFDSPVAVTANTTYVASYHTTSGNYAGDNNGFANAVDNAPLHALRDGQDGGNGLYAYGATSQFPTATWAASNYWVDVVFSSEQPNDTTGPTVTSTTPANGAVDVNRTSPVTATFNEPLDQATVSGSTVTLTGPGGAAVPANVSYSAATRTVTLQPSAQLAQSTAYTATFKGGAGTAIKDTAGNAMAANVNVAFTTAGPGPCDGAANPVVVENCKAGTSPAVWDVNGVGDPSIQGFATDISADQGQSIGFKVDTTASSFAIDIYRLGYYGGNGARLVDTIPAGPLVTATNQPNCLNQAATGLIDCGNWSRSATWNIPADATSGLYIARPRRTDNGGASHIPFVVRDDSSTSDMVFQTSDTTWQAYNNFGGNSLYTGSPAGRAYKVSYNRPFATREVDDGQDWIFNAEYPMIRWLERNGYDVSYISGLDSHRSGQLIRQHKTFLSVGHDEYWSGGQRSNVEAARDAGVNLAFLSGNEVFWKTRWEPSIDGSNTAHRTLVTYKETHANDKIDPDPAWTGTWRDPRFSPPADGGRPENALTGQLFMINNGATTAIEVPEADGKMRLWRNTSVANLATGATATLADDTLGYEWDVDTDNGFRPPGTFRMSTTVVPNAPVLTDYGTNFGSATATHNLTMYRNASGALVFGAGTVQWAWGLDNNHDRGSGAPSTPMQQATVNLFADMSAQPATLQSGLTAATKSTDTTAPTAVITSPTGGSSVNLNANVTITGTASDAGGGRVGGIEVSTDGSTWHPANGRTSWTYTWRTPATSGNATIRVRATDDSGNTQSPPTSVSVVVGSAPPAAPSGLTATAGGNGITLDWADGPTGAVGYNVYRSTSATGTFTKVNGALVTVSTFLDAQAPSGTSYYRVTAVNAAGSESAPSSVVSATITPPAAPSGLTASAGTGGITLDWADGPAGSTGYYVYRSATATGTFTKVNGAPVAVSDWLDTQAPSGTSYYRVTAVNGSGAESTPSATVNAAMTKANRLTATSNPSFEADTNGDSRPDSWTSTPRFTRSTAAVRSGTYGGRHNATTATTYTVSSANITGLTAGTTYDLRSWVNLPTAITGSFTVRIQWRNNNNTAIGAPVVVRTFNAATGGWVQASGNYAAPTGATRALIQMVGTGLVGTVYVDDVSLR